MTTEQIQEDNKLIFDFMGCVHSNDETVDLWEMSGLKYKSSWEALMPVVEKIETMLHEALIFYIKDKRAYIEVDTQAGMSFDIPDVPNCYSGFCDTKIEATWKTTTLFIQWYNSKKETNDTTPR